MVLCGWLVSGVLYAHHYGITRFVCGVGCWGSPPKVRCEAGERGMSRGFFFVLVRWSVGSVILLPGEGVVAAAFITTCTGHPPSVPVPDKRHVRPGEYSPDSTV